MPASRSPRPNSRRALGVSIAIGAIALLAVLLFALPASLATRLLPPGIQASDFSGNFWHGAAGKLLVKGIPCGAVEWQLHPGELVSLKLGIDVHWALGDFGLAARGHLGRQGIEADSVTGGGALEDLGSLTGLSGWRATVAIAIGQLSASFDRLNTIAGDINVSDLHVANIGDDINLGAYSLHFDPPAAGPAGALVGQIRDTAGPLEVRATLTLTPQSHTSVLSGTAKERASASPALRTAMEDLAQLRPRDAQGRIPLELEFSF
jgi:hypothetical protein